jgi:hypothetical protein
MIPINLSTTKAANIANLLGCNVASLPFTYLGLPLGTTKPTVQDLMPLVDRIERRVSTTSMLMSYSGKVSLINSLLTSIATFTMCSIQLHPKRYLSTLKKSEDIVFGQRKMRKEKRNANLLLHGIWSVSQKKMEV